MFAGDLAPTISDMKYIILGNMAKTISMMENATQKSPSSILIFDFLIFLIMTKNDIIDIKIRPILSIAVILSFLLSKTLNKYNGA